VETAEQIKLVFGMGASFDLSHAVLTRTEIRVSRGNLGTSKNKGTFLWNCAPNSVLEQILPQQVNRVVNKTRQSSLQITPTTVNIIA